MSETWLNCRIARGQFTGEFAVSATRSDGVCFSLFARESDLEFDEAPAGDDTVNGWLRVSVAHREGPLVLVKLPQQALESGSFVTVRESQLSQRTARQIV